MKNFINKYLSQKCPSDFQIEITSRCNLKCTICFNGYFERVGTDMSFENFKTIIDQSSNFKIIDFTGVGESLLNKDFLKMVRYAKSKKMLVMFYSNFYLLNKKIAEELIEIGVDCVIVSLDGATKETYEKIRVGSNFEIITNNVNDLFRLKKERKSKTPLVYFNYVINKYNIGEVVSFVELVKVLAVGQTTHICFHLMYKLPLRKINERMIISPDSKLLESTIQAAIKKGEDLSIPVTYDFVSPQSSMKKCKKYLKPFIFNTGDVVPCCVSFSKSSYFDQESIGVLDSFSDQNQIRDVFIRREKDILEKMSLGNIFKQNFKEIWYGNKYRQFRKILHQGGIPLFCENCPLYK